MYMAPNGDICYFDESKLDIRLFHQSSSTCWRGHNSMCQLSNYFIRVVCEAALILVTQKYILYLRTYKILSRSVSRPVYSRNPSEIQGGLCLLGPHPDSLRRKPVHRGQVAGQRHNVLIEEIFNHTRGVSQNIKLDALKSHCHF